MNIHMCLQPIVTLSLVQEQEAKGFVPLAEATSCAISQPDSKKGVIFTVETPHRDFKIAASTQEVAGGVTLWLWCILTGTADVLSWSLVCDCNVLCAGFMSVGILVEFVMYVLPPWLRGLLCVDIIWWKTVSCPYVFPLT